MKNPVGRPKVLTEEMSTVRVRVSQRLMLNALKQHDNEPHHEILGRLFKYYFDHHPKAKRRVKKALYN